MSVRSVRSTPRPPLIRPPASRHLPLRIITAYGLFGVAVRPSELPASRLDRTRINRDAAEARGRWGDVKNLGGDDHGRYPLPTEPAAR